MFNIWDDCGDSDTYDIVIFTMPKDFEIDIKEETNILETCYIVLNDYDLDDEEDKREMLVDYPNISMNDIDVAKKVLDNGNMGLIPERIAKFISSKYPCVNWEMPNTSYDLEIDIY